MYTYTKEERPREPKKEKKKTSTKDWNTEHTNVKLKAIEIISWIEIGVGIKQPL